MTEPETGTRRVLLLIPTEMELEAIGGDGRIAAWKRQGVAVQLCGFGLIAAGILASRAIAEFRPERVILAGIAGSLDPQRCPPGVATAFDWVQMDGIGVGSGAGYLAPADLGWQQFPTNGSGWDRDDSLLPLGSPGPGGRDDHGGLELLSVCSASADAAGAGLRRNRYPRAAAEDMEGYAVAAACRLAGLPLLIVRGISNLAGNRAHADWKLKEALQSTADWLQIELNRGPGAGKC